MHVLKLLLSLFLKGVIALLYPAKLFLELDPLCQLKLILLVPNGLLGGDHSFLRQVRHEKSFQ
jgi:hypothetical protein